MPWFKRNLSGRSVAWSLLWGAYLGCANNALANGTSSTYRCSFVQATYGEFLESETKLHTGNSIGEIVFDQLTPTTQTARMIGNSGATNVQVLTFEKQIHIFEITGTNNLTTTTIFLDENNPWRSNPAVHSRHISLSKGPFPSQSLGYCKKVE